MKKLILILCLTFTTSWLLWSPHARAAEIKTGYFFNWEEGEQKPIVATPIKSWKKLNIDIDLWATDIDQLSDGITANWSGGVDVSYNIPVTVLNKQFDISTGIGCGFERPLDDEYEFVYGAMVYGVFRF